jgi:ketosteroid isomerase-like protein
MNALTRLAVAAGLLVAPLALARTGPDTTAVPHSDWDEMVASEHAFAGLAAEKGTKEAFLTYLASDAVVFTPAPVNARRVWEARADKPTLLAWQPAFAEVSGTGDLGWTTGPWEYSADRAAGPSAFGSFVTVWGRSNDGRWRVEVDMGVSHERTVQDLRSVDVVPGPLHPIPKAPPRGGFGVGLGVGGSGGGFGVGVHTGAPYPRELEYEMSHQIATLLATDRTYGFQIGTQGARTALDHLAGDDVRFYREGQAPAIGREAAAAWHDHRKTTIDTKNGGRIDWVSKGQGIAIAADLGYVYGLVARRANGKAAPDTSSYLHIWRKDQRQKWQLALDIENEFPAHVTPSKP